ncbi:MAG TPA: hypothetical protein VK790_05330 [Solirubrobacteraceae bacterium]|nr:hypothetical protein [Solirubrobacteraceae bacterium]
MPAPSSPDAGSRSPRAGLCETCAHQQLVRNTRGSTFSLCRRSREDPAYPRYPRVPVLECPGYTPSGPRRERGAQGGGGG